MNFVLLLFIYISYVSSFSLNVPNLGFYPEATYSSKTVALTFNDAPDGHNYTLDLIATLKFYGVNATFFVNTQNYINLDYNIIGQQALFQLIQNKFTIGLETIDHQDIGKLSISQIVNEIIGEQQELNNIVCSNSNLAPPQLTLFRSPYGDPYINLIQCVNGTCDTNQTLVNNNQIAQLIAALGYFHVGWDIDSDDYDCPTIECIENNIIEDLNIIDNSILLFRSVYKNTTLALPTIIETLLRKGIKFVSVEELIKTKYGNYSSSVMLNRNGYSLVQNNICPSKVKITSQPNHSNKITINFGLIGLMLFMFLLI